MEIVGLKGDKVRLVPVDKTFHLENAIRWYNDPEVTRYLILTTGGHSRNGRGVAGTCSETRE